MKTIKTGTHNVFQTVIRKVVKEELEIVEKRLVTTLDERIHNKFVDFEDKVEDKLSKFRNEIMTAIDQLTGMFKKHFEEHEILNGQHKRIIGLEEKVESLEKIHPLGQHSQI